MYKEMEQSNMIAKISSIKELFNNIRDTLFREEINKIRTNMYKKEAIYDYLSKTDKISSKESQIIDKISTYFNKLHDDLSEKNIYRDNISYRLDLSFNDDDYYKLIEIKSAFDASYVLYESNGDKKGLLSISEYFIKICFNFNL